ncbi:hypothetical protein V8G54_030442 [Vigna mungo]|uniref:DnaJ homologue subfamily C member 28 conserved domain-containing protein n=1 Tax=Vigna mungo TaxID=3915 RepID=A0AAQ3RLA3_VIGMU
MTSDLRTFQIRHPLGSHVSFPLKRFPEVETIPLAGFTKRRNCYCVFEASQPPLPKTGHSFWGIISLSRSWEASMDERGPGGRFRETSLAAARLSATGEQAFSNGTCSKPAPPPRARPRLGNMTILQWNMFLIGRASTAAHPCSQNAHRNLLLNSPPGIGGDSPLTPNNGRQKKSLSVRKTLKNSHGIWNPTAPEPEGQSSERREPRTIFSCFIGKSVRRHDKALRQACVSYDLDGYNREVMTTLIHREKKATSPGMTGRTMGACSRLLMPLASTRPDGAYETSRTSRRGREVITEGERVRGRNRVRCLREGFTTIDSRALFVSTARFSSSSSSSSSSSGKSKTGKKLMVRLTAVIDAVHDRKLPPELRGQRNNVRTRGPRPWCTSGRIDSATNIDFESNAFGDIMSETDIINVVEQRIWHSMEEGQFENLPGKGKPLKLDTNPHADPAEDTLYRILSKNGCAPEWVELNKEIRSKISEWRISLKKAWATKCGGEHSEWVESSENLKLQLREINDKVFRYNLIVPFGRQMFGLKWEKELGRSCQVMMKWSILFCSTIVDYFNFVAMVLVRPALDTTSLVIMMPLSGL